MEKRRVLLLSTHPLLSEGLANLLGNVEDVILIGPRAISDLALSELTECAPDAVLVAEQETDDVIVNAFVFQILQYFPDLPVIQVSLSENTIVRIYTSHAMPARSADLIDTIRNLPVKRSNKTNEEP